MERILDLYCVLLKGVIALCLAVMVVLVFGNVVLRYGFNSGITVSEELSRWLLVWLTFLGAIVAVREHAHLGVDTLVRMLSPAGKRICFIINYCLMLFADWLLLTGSWRQTIINIDDRAPATGLSLGIFYFAFRQKLSWLRVHDYIACCVPFGLFFGRLANFVNQELWGAQTTVPWAILFVEYTPLGSVLGPPRHPSQLYEALLEGVLLAAILGWMFWRTDARYQPGKLVGAFILFYGIFRFAIEFVREPDSQLIAFAQATGLHMGQWLSLPMILGGLYLMLTANRRRVRIEGTAGTASVA